MTGQPVEETVTGEFKPLAGQALLLAIEGLGVTALTPHGPVALLADVNLELRRGQCAFVVGPSGVGKSLLLRAVLGLLDGSGWALTGSISVTGHDGVAHATLVHGRYASVALDAVRGRGLAAVFQEPTSSLHPSLTVGRQLLDVLPNVEPAEARARALAALSRVEIGEVRHPDILRRYPHELSQGERQRTCIALASLTGGVLLADEPTASLDPATMGDVARDLCALRDDRLLDALVVVTHQRALVEALYRAGDSFVVLERAGRTALAGPARARTVLPSERPELDAVHPCFQLSIVRAPVEVGAAPAVPVLTVRNLSQSVRQRWYARPRTVLRQVDIEVRTGELIGIVGPSGSGKTTLARAVIRLLGDTTGQILLALASPATDVDLVRLQPDGRRPDTPEMHAHRGHIQYISQEAAVVFNPETRIDEILAETLALDGATLTEGTAGADRVRRLCFDLGLAEDDASLGALLTRYPAQLSGGQKQRLALARALLRAPRVLVADEPFTGQDLGTVSEVIRLLDRARREHGVAIVLISHDVEVVRAACDRIFSLEGSTLVEVDNPRREESR